MATIKTPQDEAGEKLEAVINDPAPTTIQRLSIRDARACLIESNRQETEAMLRINTLKDTRQRIKDELLNGGV